MARCLGTSHKTIDNQLSRSRDCLLEGEAMKMTKCMAPEQVAELTELDRQHAIPDRLLIAFETIDGTLFGGDRLATNSQMALNDYMTRWKRGLAERGVRQ